jgi:hypothetical protein
MLNVIMLSVVAPYRSTQLENYISKLLGRVLTISIYFLEKQFQICEALIQI